MGKIYKGDIGTVLIVDVKTDISDATKLSLKVLDPDGISREWAGTLEGTTKIRYVVVEGDLNKVGIYKVQPYIERPGWTGRGETVEFFVNEVFT